MNYDFVAFLLDNHHEKEIHTSDEKWVAPV